MKPNTSSSPAHSFNGPPNQSFAVCIVTYKRDDKLVECLQKLLQSSLLPDEVFIVDNGRSSKLPEIIKGIPLPIELIYPDGNVGCAGLNEAFRKANSQFIVCLDDDSYPAPGCLERAVEILAGDCALGLIGFKVYDPDTGLAWHDERWNPDVTAPQETVYCIGCGMAFKKDHRLPEELCLKSIVSQCHELSIAAEFLRLGYKIEFRPECIAYHPNTGNRASFDPVKHGMMLNNQMVFLGTYVSSYYRFLIVLSYLLFIGFHRQAYSRPFLKSFLEAVRRPLTARQTRRFRDVIRWHVHHRLHWLLPGE